MDLFILGAGMGIVGGLMPHPLQMIALTQVALGRWGHAIFVLIVPPLIVDVALLVVTLFFFHFIPVGIGHYIGYVGGVFLVGFGAYSLWEMRRKTQEQIASSAAYTFLGVSIATSAELAAPGTWVYWLTLAGPLLAEGRVHGYGHVIPFFVGSGVGYYGAAVFSTALIAWGAGLYKRLKRHLFLAANILLVALGISYLIRAYLAR